MVAFPNVYSTRRTSYVSPAWAFHFIGNTRRSLERRNNSRARERPMLIGVPSFCYDEPSSWAVLVFWQLWAGGGEGCSPSNAVSVLCTQQSLFLIAFSKAYLPNELEGKNSKQCENSNYFNHQIILNRFPHEGNWNDWFSSRWTRL